MNENVSVLIVDDEPANRKLLEGMVRHLGYRPLVAGNGMDALAMLEQSRVDVILLDFMMAGMDGLEVLDQLALRGLTPGLPVLMVSALTDRETRLNALNRGATDFLNKPVDRAELTARLRSVVQLKNLHDQVRTQLGDSQKMHQALMTQAALPLFVLDAGGLVLECNPAALELFRPRGLAPGTRYSSLSLAEDRESIERALAEVAQDVQVRTLLLRSTGYDGQALLLDVTLSPVDTEQGRLILAIGRDVTEERKALQKLAQREEELRSAQRIGRMGSIRLLDAQTGLSEWSEETYRLLGVRPDTPNFQAYLACVHPEDRDMVIQTREAALISGRSDFEHRIIVSGNVRWLRVRGAAEPNEKGGMTRTATLQDITELKQSELEREESLRFCQSILDSLNSMVAIVDQHGLIVATNRAWREAALSRGASLESTCEGTNYLHVCKTVPEVAKAIRRALLGAPTPHPIEYECSTPTSERWFWCRITRLSLDGPVRVAIDHHEVTSLKLAERSAARRAQRLDLLTVNLPLVLWEGTWHQGSLAVNWVSENARRILGVPREGLLGVNNWYGYVHPEDRNPLTQKRFEATEQLMEEYRWCHPDGTVLHLQAGVSLRQQGAESSLMGFALDVSESKKLATVLLQAQKMEAVGHLTGGIAHDFNNILGVIRSFGGFVHQDLPAGDPRREDMEEVLSATDRAIALTRQLVAFSRPQMSSKQPLDLNHALTKLAKILQRCVGADIELQLLTSPRPAVVKLDPVHFDQLVMNLAVNARDAMPDHGWIRLSLSHPGPAEATSLRLVRLTVSDSGCGMDKITQERIFDPFFTTKEVGKGTGLGLATCYGIIKDAGGTVCVESSPGAGTTFTIDFPVCDEPLEEEFGSDPGDFEVSPGQHILVVEDDLSLRKGAVRILESAGYQVTQAQDGDEAVRLIAQAGDQLDLIFSDVVMPGRNGYEVADYVQQHGPDIPVLLTSGNLDRHMQNGGRPLNLPLIWKPYSTATLLRSIHSSLQQKGKLASGNLQHPAPPPDHPSEGAEKISLPQPSSEATKGNILLVEDETVLSRAYEQALTSAGYSVAVVGSAEAALEIRASLEFEAAVCDIGLPGMDGLALLKVLRGGNPDLPVILITGCPSVETATLAVRGRASGYLNKPVPLAMLVHEVNRAVESSKVNRLQRKFLVARTGAEEFLSDISSTHKSLDRALDALRVEFQPVVRSRDSSIFGYEALLRSDEPGLSVPQKLIAAADIVGRIEEVGLAVRQAIAQSLSQLPGHMESIFINLHPQELRSDILCAASEPLLRKASRVILEVSERAPLTLEANILEEVKLLRSAGYRLAIDDLGNGYAGLSWMAHLRPDFAKIDMSLIRGSPESALKREILASLIDVCRRSAITVVAEGLETEQEVQVLTDLGCELLQGYYFSRPGPAFPSLIEARNQQTRWSI